MRDRSAIVEVTCRLARAFRKVSRDRSGNIALGFAGASLALLTAAGGAVDLTDYMMARRNLQNEVDRAALYAGNKVDLTNTTPPATQVQTYFTKTYDSSFGALKSVTTTDIENGIVVTAVATLPTAFLKIIGIDQLTATASATVTWGDRSIEVALVLDNTGSMADSNKLSNLITAATGLVDFLKTKATASKFIKFSVVPFSNFVNVGTTWSKAAWIDQTGASPYYSTYFSSPLDRFAIYTKLGKSWPGCVETRPAPYDIDDTAPTVGNPPTLFVPSFHPDEPDSGTYSSYANDYLNDKTTSWDDLTKTTYAPKYTSPTGIDFSNSTLYSNYKVPKGPQFMCDVQPLTTLSNDYASIDAKIQAMTAAGSTNIPEGLAWGWRTLSPSGPFSSGVAYSDTTNLKIIVLLTDGTNAINTFSNALGGAYSSWGYPVSGRLGTNPGANLRTGLDTKTRSVCAAIKAKGIKIYAIGLMIDDSAGQQLLSDCSSGSGYYYNSPTADQLDSVFTSIGKKISQLRISK